MAEQDVINALEALELDIETLNTNMGIAIQLIEGNTTAIVPNTTAINSLAGKIMDLNLALVS